MKVDPAYLESIRKERYRIKTTRNSQADKPRGNTGKKSKTPWGR